MTWLRTWWTAEKDRHFLWLPVCFGAGIAAYLALPVEPPVYLLLSIWLGALVLTLLLWRPARPVVIGGLALASGLFWASLITQWTPQKILHEAVDVRPVMGTVNDIVRTEHGYRFTLDHVTIDRVQPERTPNQIRLSIRLKKDAAPELPHIGDVISIRAGLRPPMGPVLPNGFDFARYFYFRDIGAVGYGLPPWDVVAQDTAPGAMAQFRDWRVRITEEIIRTLGPETGGVGAGLITGDARAISEADFDALRASNLYHIIAISGEHMVVIAGVIFVTLRLLALLLPRRIAHRPQVKTVAACATLLLVTAYLFVTGLPVSAVRAYVMIFLVLMAVILRRRVNSMRSLALTALIMLVADPAVLIEPGFQLSFAATLAIIALVETTLLRPDGYEVSRIRKAGRVVVTMLCISVVAEMATTPLVIAQFNNVSMYGVFANMLATPIVSLYLMPTVALFFILLPFGLQNTALWLMDWGIRGLLGLSHWVAGFPHAQAFVPSIPGYGVAVFVLGLLWICLWQTRVRYWGLLVMALGVATVMTTHLPDMLVGEQLKQIAFKTNDGYVLARGRASSMIPSLWANGLGYDALPEADTPAWRCDRQGCVAQVKGKVIAFPSDPSAILEDCTRAQMIFTTYGEIFCSSAQVRILGPEMLEGSNVTAFWFDEVGGVRQESSAHWQGKRPWSAKAVDEDEDE